MTICTGINEIGALIIAIISMIISFMILYLINKKLKFKNTINHVVFLITTFIFLSFAIFVIIGWLAAQQCIGY